MTEATAASNIPSKISGDMFFTTTILQYVKDKYENLNSSFRYDPTINICGTYTISGTWNVGYVIVRGLVSRNDTIIPCSETIAIVIKFCGHVFHVIWKSYLNLYAGESVKIKPGDLMVVILHKTTTQKYYFPGMVNLVRESVECCLEVQSKQSSLSKIPLEIGTIVRIVRMSMNIEMSASEVGFRNIYYARSVIRLTICFSQEW